MAYEGVFITLIRGFEPSIEVLVIATECITARIKDGAVFDPESVEIAYDAICEWRRDLVERNTSNTAKLELMNRLELLIRSTENADVVMTKSASKT
jgi:hypothetical protein